MKIQGFTETSKFSEGKRSLIYIGKYKNKVAIAKVPKFPDIHKNMLKNEAKFLRLLNKHKIGPKLYKSSKNGLVIEFIQGTRLIDLKDSKNYSKLIKKVLLQCRTLDNLNVNKLEFTRPFKHVIVSKNKLVLIDFERCYFTKNPKNVTQFSDFIIKQNIIKIRKEDFLKRVKNYKSKKSDANFKKILSSF